MDHVAVAVISRKRPDGNLEYLLVKSTRDFGEFTDRWYPPGGHLEDGEDGRSAIVRELREELGMTVEAVEEIVETLGDVANQRTHWWKCEALSDAMCVNSDEIAEVGWFTKREMEVLRLWPATKRFFETYDS